jgi:hypothetical protein
MKTESLDSASPIRAPVATYHEEALSHATSSQTATLSSVTECASAETEELSSDPELRELQDDIKKVMVRTLVSVFSLEEVALQSSSPPTRLQRAPELSLQEARDKLLLLRKHLELCNQTCCTRIQKAVEKIDAAGKGNAPTSETSEKRSLFSVHWFRKLLG